MENARAQPVADDLEAIDTMKGANDVRVVEPKQPCRVCGNSIPVGALYCTICENWLEVPRSQRLREIGRGFLATLVIPLVLGLGKAMIDEVSAQQAHADLEKQREAQVLEALATGLQATLNVADSFRTGELSLQEACIPNAAAGTTATDRAGCRDAYVHALDKMDDVLSNLAWALATVPINLDTHARLNDLKFHYFRSCTSADATELCGYRQKVVRYLHGRAHPDLAALKYCPSGENGADPVRCSAATESMKNEVLSAMRQDMNDLLCSVTRDANELRVRTWRDMQEGTSLSFGDLADRLEKIDAVSDCARRLQDRPISTDCPNGHTISGECLRAPGPAPASTRAAATSASR